MNLRMFKKLFLCLLFAFGGAFAAKGNWAYTVIGILLLVAGNCYLDHYWELKK